MPDWTIACAGSIHSDLLGLISFKGHDPYP